MFTVAKLRLKEYRGFHYIVPEIFNAPIEGWSGGPYSQIPQWLYTVDLLSHDKTEQLTFAFRSVTILSEVELKAYIAQQADWSLAVENRLLSY